jgi:putative heme-binding domain-containing protein
LASQNADDLRMPLLIWWAIEAKVATEPNAVVDLFRDPMVWRSPIVERGLAERLMRRFAATGSRKDLAFCAELLTLAPGTEAVKQLMSGFETAYAGRSLTNLPVELAAALEKFSGSSVVLGLRQGRADAIQEALKTLDDQQADKSKQLQYVQIFGEISQPKCVPTLIRLAPTSPDSALQTTALRSLGRYDNQEIPAAVLPAYANMTDDVRMAAGALLTSRRNWTRALLEAVDSGHFDKAWLALDLVQRMSLFSDSNILPLVQKHWPDLKPATTDELKGEIDRLQSVLIAGVGQPKAGKAIFMKQCSNCHSLFNAGGKVGPDLTSYKRDDLQIMLLSIINPSAEIREGFNTYRITTNDGRVLTGMLAEQDTQILVLRSPEGVLIPIPRDEIDEMTSSRQSMMPEGLLKGYSDQQLRDLFGYLRMTQPVID